MHLAIVGCWIPIRWKLRVFSPDWWATIASGTVDILTISAPSNRIIRYSAGVSRLGPCNPKYTTRRKGRLLLTSARLSSITLCYRLQTYPGIVVQACIIDSAQWIFRVKAGYGRWWIQDLQPDIPIDGATLHWSSKVDECWAFSVRVLDN